MAGSGDGLSAVAGSGAGFNGRRLNTGDLDVRNRAAAVGLPTPHYSLRSRLGCRIVFSRGQRTDLRWTIDGQKRSGPEESGDEVGVSETTGGRLDGDLARPGPASE